MELKELIRQYRGATLPQLIQKRIRTLNQDELLQAIRATYDNFPADA